MKQLRRIVILAVSLPVIGLLLTGCNHGPQPIPPVTIEHAQQLEAANPAAAIAIFMAVKDKYASSNPDMAAEALLDLAEFTSNPKLYGTPSQVHAVEATNPSPDALKAMDDMQAQGQQQAYQALLDMTQHFANTRAARDPATAALRKIVNREIDIRNSRTISYKLIDLLVALTGRKPDFSYWFALVLLAFIIKGVTFPLMIKTYKSQREMQRMQPIIKEIQARYKEDPQEGFRKMQAAYKENGVSQFASCVPTLIQMPIFFWMFSLIRIYEIHFAYGHFLWVGSSLSTQFPGIIGANLSDMDVPLLLMYAGSMFLSMKMMPQSDPQMAEQQKMMSIFMTLFMIYWFWQARWSSAFLLYYLVQNMLSVVQQYYYIYLPNKMKLATGGVELLPAPVPASSPATKVPRPRPPSRKKR